MSRSWFAVRCCCQPTKILGFLRLEDGPIDRVVVSDVYGGWHQLLLRESVHTVHAPREIAIYADDRPIDFWRSIDGFVEAGPPAPPRMPVPSWKFVPAALTADGASVDTGGDPKAAAGESAGDHNA